MMSEPDYDFWLDQDPQDLLAHARARREAEMERGEMIADEISAGEREECWPWRLKP